MKHCPAVLTLVLLAVGASISRADIAPDPLGSGMTPRPRGESTDVAMTAEEVELGLSKDRLAVKVTFHLENFGKETTFEVGFPMNYKDELKDFTAEIDGKASVPALKEQSEEGWMGKMVFTYWLVWEMAFKPGEKKTVVVAYHVQPNGAGFYIRENSSSSWDDYLGGEEAAKAIERCSTGYILETGAPWKGSIGKATVRLKLEGGLTSANLREMSPPPSSRTATMVEWSFTDLEPTENILLEFCPDTTLDREIEIFRGIHDDEMELEDIVLIGQHLADLLQMKGDLPARRVAYESLLDAVLAWQGDDMKSDGHCGEALLEIATSLFGTPEALADASTPARAKKAGDFLEKWIPFLRTAEGWGIGDSLTAARAALVSVRRAQGRDPRDVVRMLESGGCAGASMEVTDDDAARVTLEEERVEIAVGDEIVYDTVYALRGRIDGNVTATLGSELEPAQAILVAAADGTFDNVLVTVAGAPVKVGCIKRTVIEPMDNSARAGTFVGWTFPVKAGQAVEVRVRITGTAGAGSTGYVWCPSKGGPPDDEPRFNYRSASWTARGACWKSPRKLSVAITVPKAVTAAHVRAIVPESGKLDGTTVRWSVPAADTSKRTGNESLWITWKGFTLDEEIAHLKKLVEANVEAADIVRLQLALAYRRAGRSADEIAILEILIASNAAPLEIGRSGTKNLERGMYDSRPLVCQVVDARVKLGDEKATHVAAERAVAALRAKIAEMNGPWQEEIQLWTDLAGCERLLGHDKEATAAEEKVKEIGAKSR